MSCQNLVLKPLKLFHVGVLKCRPIHSHIISTADSYSSVFSRQKLKHSFNINARLFPSNNIQTSKTYESEEELEKFIEDFTQPLVKLTFITSDQKEIEILGRVGMTVLEAALKYDIPIEAACDGKLACTTCHLYVEEMSKYSIELPDQVEDDLLDVTPFCKPNSRLSCQLIITEMLDGARFQLPAATANYAVDGKVKKHS